MAKAKRNATVGPLSGKIGELVYVDQGGQNIVRRAPRRKRTTRWTQAQQQQQKGFRGAVAYGKAVLADPARKLVYDAAGRRTRQSAYSSAIGDYQQGPRILDVDLSDYTGQTGESIVIQASDNVAVTAVTVVIRTMAATVLEQGPAAFNPKTSRWTYQTQATAPPDRLGVTIEVTATDLPGNQAAKSVDRQRISELGRDFATRTSDLPAPLARQLQAAWSSVVSH
jgi:hypothetical protein